MIGANFYVQAFEVIVQKGRILVDNLLDQFWLLDACEYITDYNTCFFQETYMRYSQSLYNESEYRMFGELNDDSLTIASDIRKTPHGF